MGLESLPQGPRKTLALVRYFLILVIEFLLVFVFVIVYVYVFFKLFWSWLFC